MIAAGSTAVDSSVGGGTWHTVSALPGVSSPMTSRHTTHSAATSWLSMDGAPTVSAAELCGLSLKQ